MSDLIPKNNLQIVLKNDISNQNKVKPKKVLDEETYVKDLESIIERDFFPDLEKLKVQQIYMQAVRTNDYETLRDLYSKYSIRRNRQEQQTPSSFETPEIRPKDKKKDEEIEENPFINEEPPPLHKLSDDTLDKYLAKNTSEDNSSFKQIMDEAEKKENLRVHRSWLVDQETKMLNKQNENLALPSIEQQAIENNTGIVETWSYKSKNALMFVPEAVELTFEERLEQAKRERIIVHENTRFKLNPFNLKQQKDSLIQAAEHKALQLSGKLGIDGKEVAGETPKVNGYGYVATTPSPSPGRLPGDESPMMTWGEIEGTPFRLEAATPYSCHSGDGPEFKIPDIPEREKIHLSLEEKASAARRKKKQEAFNLIQRNLSSPKCDSPSLQDKINFMSPAAQKLLSSKLRLNTDKSISRDNTPSPMVRTPNSPYTPLKSPNIKTSQTINNLKTTVKRSNTDNLTDNLLKLPKKS